VSTESSSSPVVAKTPLGAEDFTGSDGFEQGAVWGKRREGSTGREEVRRALVKSEIGFEDRRARRENHLDVWRRRRETSRCAAELNFQGHCRLFTVCRATELPFNPPNPG
jgi:hypothetical protein